MSAATGAIVLAGRVLFASFFGAVAGVGHIRRSDQIDRARDLARHRRVDDCGVPDPRRVVLPPLLDGR